MRYWFIVPRIRTLDVIRGVAVLGILFINFPLYVGPANAFFNWQQQPLWSGWLNNLTLLFIYVFAHGKFYTLFSFLFGAGFGIQMQRANWRPSLYARRLTLLLLLGLLHLFLLWWGDVLHIYALLGFLLLLMRGASDGRVLRVALGLMLAPMIFGGIGMTVYQLRHPGEKRYDRAAEQAKMRTDIETYSRGSLKQILVYRAGIVIHRLPGELGWASELFANFLLGLLAARRRVFEEPKLHLNVLRLLAFLALPLGLLLSFGVNLAEFAGAPSMPVPFGAWLMVLNEFLARPLAGLGYAALITLLVHAGFAFAPMAAVGRLALTNYLMATAVWTTLALSYGFGFYGSVPPYVCLVYTLLFFIAQTLFSIWWLSRYRMGPLEWLWRLLTYRRALDLSRG